MSDREPRWLALTRQLFAFNASERRELYIATLVAFADTPLDVALNLEQLAAALRPAFPELDDDHAQLTDALRMLTDEWHLLEASRDDSATYRDPQQFRNRTLQWSLTPDGSAAIAALDAAADALAAVASLQPAALDAIARGLRAVAELTENPAGDDAQIDLRLAEAEAHHRTLVENLRSFTRDVQRLLGRADASDGDLDHAKSAIIGYLNRYVIDATAPAQAVSRELDRLVHLGLENVAERAVRGMNAAPNFGGDDPTVRALAIRRRNLDALVAWFHAGPGHEAQFALLLPRGMDAMLRYMRVLDLRREQRRRAASLPEDFRSLARAFTGVSDRAEAHRLWGVVTGLYPARHHHLAVDDVVPVEAATSVANNPTVPLEVELRRRPRSTGRPGKDPPVPDARSRRSARQRSQAAELAERTKLRATLHHPTRTRLSALPDLADEQFHDLLDLLSQALGASPSSDGSRRTLSSDGQVEVVIYPHPDAATLDRVSLASSEGALDAPDLEISIRLLGIDVLTGVRAGQLDDEPGTRTDAVGM